MGLLRSVFSTFLNAFDSGYTEPDVRTLAYTFALLPS